MSAANAENELDIQGDGAGTEAARVQTFMGAFYNLVGHLRRCLQTQEHDIQRLQAQEGPIRRLLATVNDVSAIVQFYHVID